MNTLGEKFMNTGIINEQQLQIEVDKLKTEFVETKDIYREVCVLLFFRYGITPTANKLYQYVRRGSMSAPAEALNKFWQELREKSRVRIERTDLPENVASMAGELVSNLWKEAQIYAQVEFNRTLVLNNQEMEKLKLETKLAISKSDELEVFLKNEQQSLKNALNRLSETEYSLAVNTNTLDLQKNSFNALKNDYDQLLNQITSIKASFSCDLDIYRETIEKAEIRYNALEKKSLLEIDNSRQLKTRLQKDLKALENKKNLEIKVLHSNHENTKKKYDALEQRFRSLEGKYTEVSKQLRISIKNANRASTKK